MMNRKMNYPSTSISLDILCMFSSSSPLSTLLASMNFALFPQTGGKQQKIQGWVVNNGKGGRGGG